MLVTIIIWAYLTLLFLTYGAGTVSLIRRSFSLQIHPPIPLSVTLLLGLAMNAWLSSVLSLVMKVGLVAHLLVLAGAFLILFFQYGEIKTSLLAGFNRKHWMVWILIFLTCITTILYAVKIPNNPDTPLYHAQAIHWIEEYPAVPGLGNLEPRLGANSNWFTLIASFSFSFLGFQSFHIIPSFLFLVVLIYFLSGFQSLLEGDFRLSQIVKLGFIPLSFYILMDEISSPGTDLPVILFYWVILCVWLESIESDSSQLLQVVIFFFSVLVVTFKLSGILILFTALQILFRLEKQKDYHLLWSYGVLAMFVLLPWIIRTFILTGYWLYPEPAMQTFSPHVDWVIPTDRVLAFRRGVQAWALSPGTQWDDVSGLSPVQRLGFWFSNLTLNQKSITVIALLSPILFWLFSLFSKRNENKFSYTSVVIFGFLSFLFWLLTAPNYRFGYGFVFGLILTSLGPVVKFAFEHVVKYRFYLLATIALALSLQQVYVILGSERDDTRYAKYMILPADYPHAATDACNLDGATISCARKYRQCGYDAFPCVPQIPRNVEMRGDTFRDGFRRISTDP